MNKKVWFVVLLLAGLAACIYAVQRHKDGDSATHEGGRFGSRRAGEHGGGRGGREEDRDLPVPVTVGTVEKRDVPIYLNGIGTVQAFNTVTVHARVDAELEKVVFTEGQDVKAGDLLAQIDARPYQAQLDQAVAKKAQDEANLANARSVAKRNEELLSKRVLDEQSYDTQKFLVDQMVATVEGDVAAIDNARTQLAYTQITAPISGRVGVRLVDQGNIIHASDAGGLVVITQLHPISVIFTLPEQSFQLIRDNSPDDPAKNPMTVLAVGRDNSNLLGKGTLAVIDNQIDQTTGTIKLKSTFANEDLRLWPGQFVNARLLLTTRKDGIVVPANVVQRGPQGAYAFVIKPDMTVDARNVKVAQIEDGVALLDEGLQAGERVVTDGQYKLQDGSKIEISAPTGAPAGSPYQDGARQGGRRAAADGAARPGAQVAAR